MAPRTFLAGRVSSARHLRLLVSESILERTSQLASPALAVVMAQIGPGIALDGGEEDKTLQEEYQSIMRGLQGVARIMSTGFEKASSAVQDVVNRSLARVIRHDLHFIEGASSMLMRWVRAVQPAIDSLD